MALSTPRRCEDAWPACCAVPVVPLPALLALSLLLPLLLPALTLWLDRRDRESRTFAVESLVLTPPAAVISLVLTPPAAVISPSPSAAATSSSSSDESPMTTSLALSLVPLVLSVLSVIAAPSLLL